jgi:hemerythrin
MTISQPLPSNPLIQWTSELSVGVEELDAQHRVLVDLINQLHHSIVIHRGGDEANAILGRLIEYTRIHFAVEESLMRLFDFPDYETHKASHEELISEVHRLHDKVVLEGKAITFELMHFLKRWLTHHIMSSDQQYTPFFLARGVQARYQKPSWLHRLWSRNAA